MPKLEYEYLVFREKRKIGKTSIWSCCNKRHGEELGEVKWYGAWRQYCYFPTVQAVYSSGCLDDIAKFMQSLKQKEG